VCSEGEQDEGDGAEMAASCHPRSFASVRQQQLANQLS
jgi:hypothetical protein